MQRKILPILLAVAILVGFIPQSAHARDARLWVEDVILQAMYHLIFTRTEPWFLYVK